VTFLVGLLGFADVSAIGGASVNFAMLVTARACQGAFAAILVPAALSLLTTTFTEPGERGRAVGVYGSIAAGGAVSMCERPQPADRSHSEQPVRFCQTQPYGSDKS
jgi:MFS family permease